MDKKPTILKDPKLYEKASRNLPKGYTIFRIDDDIPAEVLNTNRYTNTPKVRVVMQDPYGKLSCFYMTPWLNGHKKEEE